ncbi:c-type cytochrome [Afifella pfennigii]|uniref:c-type cytochrome n=1 Tax=Afifella pfennigii TaxID=209897 RepID=UPI000A012C0A|nr:cytochrome c [Afifella pfennigii]
MRRYRIALFIGLLLPGSAAAQDLERGRQLAEEYCAPCHAVGGQGESPMQPAPAFRDLAQRYPIDTLWEALAEGIVTGHAEMPEFQWPPKDIDDILSYISSIQEHEFRGDDIEAEDEAGSTPQ